MRLNDALDRLNTADALLRALPTRARLAACPRLEPRRVYGIRVDRTMPFEFVAGLMPPFCGLWEAGIAFAYSGYDAALPELGGDLQADAYIVWLDWRGYAGTLTAREAADWLESRIGRLREASDRPVLVNNWPGLPVAGDLLFSPLAGGRGWFQQLNGRLAELAERSSGCHLIDLGRLAQEAAGSVYDERNDELSGYPFSDKATMLAARHLGTHLLPALLAPRLKAIAVDLDDTLYEGVLGEDGVHGVVLTEGHRELQKLLRRLARSGLLLAVCSRNEERDAEALFAVRDDFPLKRPDFAAVFADWLPKADNLARLARVLNIDPSSILFVDDNPAELLAAAAAFPDMRLLHASGGGRETANALCHYPGLYQLRPDGEAAGRTADIRANGQRERLRREASDDGAYLAALKMTVTIYENEPAHAGRLYDLSRKTNQFNLALRRMTEVEAREAAGGDAYMTVTVGLSDRLSDSGIVGAFVCRLHGEEAQLIETLFSCRALGRDVETVSLAAMLDKLTGRGVARIGVERRPGPRNAPALAWLKRLGADAPAPLPLEDLRARVKAACANHPAIVEVKP